MFTAVSKELDVPALERAQIERWRARDTMARYLARNAGSDRRYSFLDGPITANNPMGVHHAWGRTYKDLYQRYHTMLGERQRYQNGFDCQGLWIEVEVEKELGFNNKRQIEEYGIDRFVERLQGARRHVRRRSRPSRASGSATGWTGSTATTRTRDENNYTIWAFLEECHRRGLALPRPRRDAVVPALRHRPVGTWRSRPRATARSRHLSLTLRFPITTAGHEGEDAARLDDDAVDPLLRTSPPR